MTGRIGTRASSGMPSIEPLQTPAAITTCSALIVSPPVEPDPAHAVCAARDREPRDRDAGTELHAGPRRGDGQRGRQQARIDRVVVGDLEREPQHRRERRLEAPRLARQQPADGQSEALAQGELAIERLRLVGVSRRRDRPAREVSRIASRGVDQLRHERRIGACARETEAEQRLLAVPASLIGAIIPAATREVPAPGCVALEHRDAQAALGCAPRHCQPDHAAADDGYVN